MNLDDVELNNKHDFAAKHASELLSIIIGQRKRREYFLNQVEKVKRKCSL